MRMLMEGTLGEGIDRLFAPIAVGSATKMSELELCGSLTCCIAALLHCRHACRTGDKLAKPSVWQTGTTLIVMQHRGTAEKHVSLLLVLPGELPWFS
jgi:hypothetical protein